MEFAIVLAIIAKFSSATIIGVGWPSVSILVDLAIDIEPVAMQLEARSSEVGRQGDEKECMVAPETP